MQGLDLHWPPGFLAFVKAFAAVVRKTEFLRDCVVGNDNDNYQDRLGTSKEDTQTEVFFVQFNFSLPKLPFLTK